MLGAEKDCGIRAGYEKGHRDSTTARFPKGPITRNTIYLSNNPSTASHLPNLEPHALYPYRFAAFDEMKTDPKVALYTA